MTQAVLERTASTPLTCLDRPLNIVMADDDPADQHMVTLAIDRVGLDANLTFMSDGIRLMTYLSGLFHLTQLPDLILLDIRMPYLDGHGALDDLQAHPVLWQIPVIVFTSSELPCDQRRAIRRGASWFEVKPRSFTDLKEIIRTFPDRSRRSDYQLPPGYSEYGERDLGRLVDHLQMIDDIERWANRI